MKLKTFMLFAVVGVATSVNAASISKPYTFSSGAVAKANEVNANFDALYTKVNELDGSAGLPSGVIVMWSGSVASIPGGWALCNGSNGTPNLSNRFIMGTTTTPGATGGTNTLNLSHTHSVSISTNVTGAHTHTYSGTTGRESAEKEVDNSNDVKQNTIADNGHTHAYNGTTSSTGTHSHSVSGTSASNLSSSVDNRPAYYTLAFIMKL